MVSGGVKGREINDIAENLNAAVCSVRTKGSADLFNRERKRDDVVPPAEINLHALRADRIDRDICSARRSENFCSRASLGCHWPAYVRMNTGTRQKKGFGSTKASRLPKNVDTFRRRLSKARAAPP